MEPVTTEDRHMEVSKLPRIVSFTQKKTQALKNVFLGTFSLWACVVIFILSQAYYENIALYTVAGGQESCSQEYIWLHCIFKMNAKVRYDAVPFRAYQLTTFLLYGRLSRCSLKSENLRCREELTTTTGFKSSKEWYQKAGKKKTKLKK